MFVKKKTPFGNDVLRRKRCAAKFHAEPTSYHAEINFLGLFREENVFVDFACFSGPGTAVENKKSVGLRPWIFGISRS